MDFDKDKRLIIHQTLALGSADDVRALFRERGEEEIKREFQHPVKGLYHPGVLELFQHILKVRLWRSKSDTGFPMISISSVLKKSTSISPSESGR